MVSIGSKNYANKMLGSDVSLYSLKDICSTPDIVAAIKRRERAVLGSTTLSKDDIEAPLVECLWELALKLRWEVAEAEAAIAAGILETIAAILANRDSFGGHDIECSLSVLLELCRYGSTCRALVAKTALVQLICAEAFMGSYLQIGRTPSHLQPFIWQASLDTLGRCLAALSDDPALLKAMAKIICDKSVVEGRNLAAISIFETTFKQDEGACPPKMAKFLDLVRTLERLQRAVDAAKLGNPMGGKGWKSHYSMEKHLVDDQKAMVENLQKMSLAPGFADFMKESFPGKNFDDRIERHQEAPKAKSAPSASSSIHACAYCNPLTTKPNLKCCARCKNVWYCNQECQKLHWHASHRRDCVPMRVKK